MDELMLDGNAAGPVGAMHLFRGAGMVLRCPHCDHALVKIVEGDTRMWFDFGGMQALEISF